MEHNNVYHLLQQTHTNSLLKQQKLITIPKDIDLREGFNILVENQIHSAPLVDTHGNACGLIDMKDFAACVLYAYGKLPGNAGDQDRILISAEEVANLSKQDKFVPIRSDANLMSALKQFYSGVHRLVVVDSNPPHKLIGMLSQIDIAAWVCSNKRIFEKKTVSEMNVIHGLYNQVISVREEGSSLLDVFKMNFSRSFRF